MAKQTQKRQAVILIHGIGEQHPIITLRGFVESLAEQLKKNKLAKEDEVVFWDKPDSESGNYETRKMTMRMGRNHSTTDFFEFYWAHHLRDTNFAHIKDWLQRVVFRLPPKVSKRLRPVFFFLWFLIIAALSFIGITICHHGFNNAILKITEISSGIIFTIILGILSHFLFNYLGDAARYLDPSPGNIQERMAIRMEGLALLRKLHESGKYHRIIIVSHSLGSAIAYDLVSFLWNEYYKSFDSDRFYSTYKSGQKDLLHKVSNSEIISKKLAEGKSTIEEYRASQEESFEYLQNIGNKWLITDLLTIGSPLTHAGQLFAQQDGLFEKLKDQREYPTCPPHFQKPDKTNIIPSKEFFITGVDHPFTLKHYNHSSPFAVTKWTNIYYSSDYVGGPLRNSFGLGIEDIKKEKRNFLFMYPAGHTQYWDFKNNENVLDDIWEILKSK